MAGTIDQMSILAHPSWREAVARTARQRTLAVPDTRLRSRQAGLVVIAGSLVQSARTTGVAAYARQQEQYSLWKAAADSRPRRAVTVPTPARDRGTGLYLDLKL